MHFDDKNPQRDPTITIENICGLGDLLSSHFEPCFLDHSGCELRCASHFSLQNDKEG
jgi:hypothetical protein